MSTRAAMRAFAAILALVGISGACSDGDDASPGSAGASAGAGGADASLADALGGSPGCRLPIGCPVGYEREHECSPCEPIAQWCPEGYLQCQELASCDGFVTAHHELQPECCACVALDSGAPIDAAADVAIEAGDR